MIFVLFTVPAHAAHEAGIGSDTSGLLYYSSARLGVWIVLGGFLVDEWMQLVPGFLGCWILGNSRLQR